ncbi:hypothetical protein ARTHRO9AX_190117 [Arthrobacter sp. 9AX]|nr:hypothetical protein ARTHRO9AX_190117 [Arthrobacter sp. 9AX]
MQTGARKTSGSGSEKSARPPEARARKAQSGTGPSRFKVTDWPDEPLPDIAEDPEDARTRGAAAGNSTKGSSPSLGFKDFVWPETNTSL